MICLETCRPLVSRRICNIHTTLLTTEIVRRAEDIDQEFSNVPNVDRLGWVFQKLADHGRNIKLVEGPVVAYNRTKPGPAQHP